MEMGIFTLLTGNNLQALRNGRMFLLAIPIGFSASIPRVSLRICQDGAENELRGSHTSEPAKG